MVKHLRIEGVMFIPPDKIIRNPEIITTPRGISIRHGSSKNFTHKGVVIPSLVNCHTHLDIIKPIYAEGFIPWLEKIILSHPRSRKVNPAVICSIKRLRSIGVTTFMDITRDPAHPGVKEGIIPFMEITGDENTPLPPIPEGYMISPHAVYSTSESLLRSIAIQFKDRLISIHVSESLEEKRFIQGKPNLIEERIYPLVGRKRKVGAYRSSVEYLSKVGLLRKNSILVHCCFIDERDADLIARYGCTVCICPRSNLYLAGRMAPVRELLSKGVNLVMGTDSLGSSPSLNLWEEAQTLFLTEKIAPETILAMLTVNPRKLITDHNLLILDISPCEDIRELSFRILFSPPQQ